MYIYIQDYQLYDFKLIAIYLYKYSNIVKYFINTLSVYRWNTFTIHILDYITVML